MLTKKMIVLEPDKFGQMIVVSPETGKQFPAIRFVSGEAGAAPEDRTTTDDICLYVPQVVAEEFGMPSAITVTIEPGDKLNEDEDA